MVLAIEVDSFAGGPAVAHCDVVGLQAGIRLAGRSGFPLQAAHCGFHQTFRFLR